MTRSNRNSLQYQKAERIVLHARLERLLGVAFGLTSLDLPVLVQLRIERFLRAWDEDDGKIPREKAWAILKLCKEKANSIV